MIFLNVRVRDALSKSWGRIVGIARRGNVIQCFRIELDSGVIVERTRAELFTREKRKALHLRLAWDRDTQPSKDGNDES